MTTSRKPEKKPTGSSSPKGSRSTPTSSRTKAVSSKTARTRTSSASQSRRRRSKKSTASTRPMSSSSTRTSKPLSRTERRRKAHVRRSRLVLAGSALLAAVILVAWFPASQLYRQRQTLATATAQLNQLRQQDAALAKERVDLDSSGELSRLAREQYQLVTPGQQAFAVLPPNGSSVNSSTTPYPGDPGLIAPVSPSGASELPPGTVSSSSTSSSSPTTTPKRHRATKSVSSSAAPLRPRSSVRSALASPVVGPLALWH